MEQKEIIQLVRYQKLGEQTSILREIPADTKEDAESIIKQELYSKGLERLNEEIARKYTFKLIDSYRKDSQRFED